MRTRAGLPLGLGNPSCTADSDPKVEGSGLGESGTSTVESVFSLPDRVTKPESPYANSGSPFDLEFLLPTAGSAGFSYETATGLQPGKFQLLDDLPYTQGDTPSALTGEEPSPMAYGPQQGLPIEECEADHRDMADKAHTSTMHERKSEQNRRAQAKFRQRKKDKFLELQSQHEELSSRYLHVVQEKRESMERTAILQEMMDNRDQEIAMLKVQTKEHVASAELTDAFWEMVIELKRARPDIMETRESIIALVNAMLNWRSAELGFIRREVVGQLNTCLMEGGEREEMPANLLLNDLVAAYNKLVHKCGECHPLAFRMFLGLHLPEQMGVTVDAIFWKKVLEAGALNPWQKQQLVHAYRKLMDKMQQHMDSCSNADPTQNHSKRDISSHNPLLDNMEQATHVLDLHAHILKEEQAAVFNFRTGIGLVLEPVQQAKLMVASFPFALDSLAICSVIIKSMDSPTALTSDTSSLPQLPPTAPFQTPASTSLPVGSQPAGQSSAWVA